MATKKKKPRPYSTTYQAPTAEAAKRYLLSGIPPKLWRTFQARCKREHVAMRQVILAAVDDWTRRPAEAGARPAPALGPGGTAGAPAAHRPRRQRESACGLVLPGQLHLFETSATPGSVSAPRTPAAATGPRAARRRRG